MPKRKASASPPAPNKRHRLPHGATTPSTASDNGCHRLKTAQSLAADREEYGTPNTTALAAASSRTRVSAAATIGSSPEATSSDEDEDEDEDETAYEYCSAAAAAESTQAVAAWTAAVSAAAAASPSAAPFLVPSEAATSGARASSIIAFDYVNSTAANAVVQEASSEAPSPSATSGAPAASLEPPASSSVASSHIPSTIIDHLSFPHIMDAIIAAADIPTLSTLALTCRKYYDQLYVGPHSIITKESGGFSFAPAHDPSDKWIPATFREGSEHMAKDQSGSDAERLRRLRVVDMTVDIVSPLNRGKLHECIHPVIFRARPDTFRPWKWWNNGRIVANKWENRPFVPVVTDALIFVLDNIAWYNRLSGEFVHQERGRPKFICDEPTTGATAGHIERPQKVVMAVRYHPDRPARFKNFDFSVRAPIVVHFVKVDDRSLDRHAPTAEGAFGACQVYRLLSRLGRAVGAAVTVTVVGLETIHPWTFAKDKSKATRIAHLDPNAREQHIRHLFRTGSTTMLFGPPAANFQFVTAYEYARGVSPTVLALERAEGFPFK